MPDDSLSGKCLRVLIGDAVHDVPPRFVGKLQSILEEQAQQHALADPRMTTHGLHADACPCWKQDAIFMGRTLQSLSAILEILDAAVADEPDEDGERMLAPHLVSGLVAAGRNLVRSAESRLEAGR